MTRLETLAALACAGPLSASQWLELAELVVDQGHAAILRDREMSVGLHMDLGTRAGLILDDLAKLRESVEFLDRKETA